MEGPFTFDSDRIAYIWETEEGEHPHSVYSELAFFIKEQNGLYRRFDEVHTQRTFTVNDYVEMLMVRVFQWNGFSRTGKTNHRTMKVNDYSFKSENEPFHLAVNHI